MTKYDFKAHIEETSQLYAKSCQLMIEEMEKHFHKSVTFTRPEGGMFIMAFLPEGFDSEPFVKEAIEKNVACIPGVIFMPDEGGKSNSFRLNFSTPSYDDIRKGIEILGKMTYEYIEGK